MRGLLRWILLMVLIGGLVAFVVGVPIEGRTVLDRILGQPAASPVGPAGSVSLEDRTGGSDQLTDKDRQGLNKLIESRLEPGPAKERGKAELPQQK